MLRRFGYLVCAAVVGFTSPGGADSVAPACEPCGTCNHAPAIINTVPPRHARIRWVGVYEGGRFRLVPRAYRVPVSDRANLSAPATTAPVMESPAPAPPALEVPASKNNPVSGRVPSGPAPADPVSSDRLALANRAQALLKAKCVRCHGDQRQESGLDLRSRETILKGGESGAGLIPGKPDESLMFKRVRAGEMPPRNVSRLSPDEIATLQQWIAAGAPSERAQQR